MTGAAGAMLIADRLTRVHGTGPAAVTALNDVSFSVAPGELLAVMGPSGSGKSTLLNLLGGLDTPTSGTVHVLGEKLSTLDFDGRAELRRTRIGYVFQDFNLIPALTALENVILPLELDGLRRSASKTLANAALEATGIRGLADRFPDQLSGGQQQRVAIARALVGQRRVLLADEPTGALDSSTGEAVMRLLRTQIDAGACGVMVTHEPRFAAWADRTIFLRDGKIVDITTRDSPDILLRQP